MLRRAAVRALEWLMLGYAALVWVLVAAMMLPLLLLDACFRRLP